MKGFNLLWRFSFFFFFFLNESYGLSVSLRPVRMDCLGKRVTWIKAFSLLHLRVSNTLTFILSLSVQYYSLPHNVSWNSIYVVCFYKKLFFFYLKCNVISFKFVSACEKVVQYDFLAGDARVFHENGNEASQDFESIVWHARTELPLTDRGISYASQLLCVWISFIIHCTVNWNKIEAFQCEEACLLWMT